MERRGGGAISRALPALRLSADTVGPVSRGHPWVYAEGLAERPPVGEPVRLVDGRGRLVGFGLGEKGPIAVRVLGRHPQPLPELLAQRITHAVQGREGLLPPDTNAYRLVNGAGDGLPGVVVDRYGSLLVLRLYGSCWEPHVADLTPILAAIPGVSCVVRRFGVRAVDGGKKGIETLHGAEPPETLVVLESGLRFLVRPRIGQKTGLFLDQREHRRLVGRLARDRKVVNLFAYTGGFSLYAAVAGARSVVTVDTSAGALDDARANFRLNDLDPDRYGFECRDAFRWTNDAGEKVGLLVCDPPSLAHSGRADSAMIRAYQSLATRTGAAVEAGGLLATASCTARLSPLRWEQAIRDGLRKSGRWSWIWRSAEPPDHPISTGHLEGRYLKFGVLRRR